MGAMKTTQKELKEAIAAGRRRRAMERRAADVRYDSDRDAIEIELIDGAAVRLPRTMVEEFRIVAPEDMAAVRVSPAGYGIRLDKHDINISVHGLIGSLATAGGMAAALGQRGGAVRSEAKRLSARANGTKGGRPRKIRQKCIFCNTGLPPNTKPEHILQSALGGRKSSRSIVCNDHNEQFGSTIDQALANQVEVIRNFLQLNSGGGKAPPSLKRVNAGKDIVNVRSDGFPELALRPFSIIKRDDGSVAVQVMARSEDHLASLMPHIVPYAAATTGLSVEQLQDQMRVVRAVRTTRRAGKAHFELALGVPDAVRAMTKSCLELWATLVGNDEVRSSPYEAARNFVLVGDKGFEATRTHLDARPLPPAKQLMAEFGDFFNLIYVRSDVVGKVIAHFRLYNILGWQMELAEHGGRPNMAVGLASNPLDPGKWSDTVAVNTEIDVKWLSASTADNLDHVRERFVELYKTYARRAAEREIDSIFQACLSDHGLIGRRDDPEGIPPEPVIMDFIYRFVLFSLGLPFERSLTSAEIERLLAGGQ